MHYEYFTTNNYYYCYLYNACFVIYYISIYVFVLFIYYIYLNCLHFTYD